jgi:hypothetical protein
MDHDKITYKNHDFFPSVWQVWRKKEQPDPAGRIIGFTEQDAIKDLLSEVNNLEPNIRTYVDMIDGMHIGVVEAAGLKDMFFVTPHDSTLGDHLIWQTNTFNSMMRRLLKLYYENPEIRFFIKEYLPEEFPKREDAEILLAGLILAAINSDEVEVTYPLCDATRQMLREELYTFSLLELDLLQFSLWLEQEYYMYHLTSNGYDLTARLFYMQREQILKEMR